MQNSEVREYLRLCLRYRAVTVVLCTGVYLLQAADGRGLFMRLWVAAGMLLAGFLSNWLYSLSFRYEARAHWVKALLVLELFFYGLFTFLSGGLSSPYLWYYISCLFMMLSLRQSRAFTVAGVVWCLLWVISGQRAHLHGLTAGDPVGNLATGAVVMVGTFYVLLQYIGRLDALVLQQRLLNLRLQEEMERGEQALLHITELYDTLNLFAMSDPGRVMQALGMTLGRTVAPGGYILVKYDLEGGVERQEIWGVEEDEGALTLQFAAQTLREAETGWQPVPCPGGQAPFEGVYIGEPARPRGLLLRRRQPEPREKQDLFYCGVIEIVFRNMDCHRELEAYIAAEEKNRFVEEIHDTVLQKLFGLVCGLKLLEEGAPTLPGAQLELQLRLLKCSAESTMTELRHAIYGKRFEGAGAHCFAGRVQAHMEEMARLSGVCIDLRLPEEAEDMTASQKIVLYRISCEAVSNAVCHGRARLIQVRLGLTDRDIQMEVKDDGTGISAGPREALRGNGLRNMHRMVTLLGGQLMLQSCQGQGTTVKLRLPR